MINRVTESIIDRIIAANQPIPVELCDRLEALKVILTADIRAIWIGARIWQYQAGFLPRTMEELAEAINAAYLPGF